MSKILALLRQYRMKFNVHLVCGINVLVAAQAVMDWRN